MADEVKRLRYFKGFFLQEKDFTDEQTYLNRMRYLHNRWLHTWGVANGLTVTAVAGAKKVTVSRGMALLKFTENGEELVKEAVLTSDSDAIDIPGGANTEKYIVLTADYSATMADPQAAEPRENTRYIERVSVAAVDTLPKPNNENAIILAKVTINAGNNGLVTPFDVTERLRAGAVVSNLLVDSLQVTSNVQVGGMIQSASQAFVQAYAVRNTDMSTTLASKNLAEWETLDAARGRHKIKWSVPTNATGPFLFWTESGNRVLQEAAEALFVQIQVVDSSGTPVASDVIHAVYVA